MFTVKTNFCCSPYIYNNRTNCVVPIFGMFTDSALWTRSVIKSICFVLLSPRHAINFKGLLPSTSFPPSQRNFTLKRNVKLDQPHPLAMKVPGGWAPVAPAWLLHVPALDPAPLLSGFPLSALLISPPSIMFSFSMSVTFFFFAFISSLSHDSFNLNDVNIFVEGPTLLMVCFTFG